ncbi:MAG: hypothetical protein R6U51_06480 [Anaerolineales bacterium]
MWWSIGFSIASLIISAFTFYFAHLRGSIIELALPSDPLRPPVPSRIDYKFYVNTRVAIVSRGYSPGILYSFRVEPGKYVSRAVYDFYETDFVSSALPKALATGEDFPIKIEAWVTKEEILAAPEKDNPTIQIIYTVSSSLGRKTTKRKTVEIVFHRPE